MKSVVDHLSQSIIAAKDKKGIEDLKTFMCLALHLLNYYNDKIYRHNKIFISGQHGYWRHDKAIRYAKGKSNG